MNKKAGLSGIKGFFFVISILFFCSLVLVNADIISKNPAGSLEHVATPEKFIEGFFFGYNLPPVITNVILNSTSGNNKTTDNLTVYYSSIDFDGDALTNITDWRKNGASIAVLNMPFDTRVTSTATGAVRDYSTYGNNGTLGGGNAAYAPTWTSSGKIGGAYSFDGVNDYIDCGSSVPSLNSSYTIILWIYANQRGGIFSRSVGAGWLDERLVLHQYSNNKLRLTHSNGATYSTVDSSSNISLGKWMHVAVSWNGTYANFYFNGSLDVSRSITQAISDSGVKSWIGKVEGLSPNLFNGSIDEVQIFNHSLSPEQINAMYRAGLANHSVELMVSNETRKGERWQVAVTPNDGYEDGATVLSNNLTIATTSVSVNLTSPLANWYSNNHILFECNASSDVSLKNSTLYTNYSGSWTSNSTNISLSGTSSSVLFNETGFGTEKNFLWNCLFCDVEHSCNFSVSNRSLTTDLTKPLIDYVSPTSLNGTIKPSYENYSYVNVTSTDASNNFSVITDWNRSLVGWWRMEQGNGTFFVDSSSYGNNGTCASATTCPNLTQGVRGKAYEFDGVNDYVEFSSNPIAQNNFTISMWFNVKYAESYDILYSGADNVDIQLFFHSTTKCLTTSVENYERCSNFYINQHYNEWNQLTWTHEGTNTKLYINGNKTLDTTDAFYTSNGETIRIGNTVPSNANYYLNGSIDEVQIYNRALTPQEINASYQASLYKYYNNFTSLNPGNYTHISYAYDQAGNINSTDTRYITINNKPSGPTSVILNATSPSNLTSDNLTAYIYGSSDLDLNPLTNITDWRKNGASIAVLNMPFDTRVTSTATGAVRDYSTHGNNGTLGGGNAAYAPTWTSSGKIGGAYSFDGVNDHLDTSLVFNFTDLSGVAWVKVLSSFPSASRVGNIMGNYPYSRNINFEIHTAGRLRFYWNNGEKDIFGTTDLRDDQWHLVAFTRNLNDNKITIYLDGQVESSGTAGSNASPLSYPIRLGGDYRNGIPAIPGIPFNGSIDEVQIFNHSLSPEQINAMYQAGLANHSVELMVSNETANSERWQVAVTPNDGIEDGNTVLSNNLSIENTPPVVVLYAPASGNVTTNRTPTFYWNGSDVDGDSLTYELDITCYNSLGGECSDDSRTISGISAQNYTITDYLIYLKDNGYYYNWTVRAHDGTAYGAWASPAWKIEIQASLDVILINDTINFGSMTMDESKNTTTNSPYPFSLQNNGNCFANVSINATQLWNTISSDSNTYEYKADNLTGEEGAFNWLASKFAWAQMPITGQSVAIAELDFNDSKDSVEVDVLVTVPNQEPSGDRQSTVYFPVSLGE